MEVDLPEAPADCADAINSQLAMVAIDIIFAAMEPTTIPVIIVLENPEPTTAAPPTNKPAPKTLAPGQEPAKYNGPLY